MNDPLHTANFTALQPPRASSSPAVLWPKLSERLTKHKFVHNVLLGRRELPLFCNPLIIFTLNWVLMLVSLSFQITYVSYPEMGMPALLFASFAGLVLVRISCSTNCAAPLADALRALSLHIGCDTTLADQSAVLCGFTFDYCVQLDIVRPPPRSR